MLTLAPETRIVALDLETTGLSSTHDRIVEMAAVCWQDGREIGAFDALVNPGRSIPADVTAIHGITDDMVRDCPQVADVIGPFIAFCQADVVVAHNASFDLGFLRAECARAGIALFSNKVVDTCALARRLMPGSPNFRLETLKALIGQGGTPSHRAFQDARDCLAIYLHCAQVARATPGLAATPAASPEHTDLIRQALIQGDSLFIEYQDARGRISRREIRPVLIDEGSQVLEAHCHLRNSTRHFHLHRIVKAWKG